LVTTDTGYDIQKYVSPVAVQLKFSFGSDVNGLGVKLSVGVPQILPVHARANLGVGYFNYSDHIGGKERSGFQAAYGFEVGVNFGGVTQITYGQTYYDSPGSKFDQRTGHITIGNPLLNVKFENDILGDSEDRYRTGALQINFLGSGIGQEFFTGDPDIDDRRGLLSVVDNFFTSDNGANPDEYRQGALYFKFFGLRIGQSKEDYRHLIQNKWIHSNTGTPYFTHLGDDDDYFYFQTGNGLGFLY